MEETFDPAFLDGPAPAANPNHGWQKVTYAKRQRKPQPPADADPRRPINGISHSIHRPHVFDSVEQKARARRLAIESAASASVEEYDVVPRSRAAPISSDEDDDYNGEVVVNGTQENGTGAPKKEKQKKPKMPKITVAEAAAKIDADDLAAFLAEISDTYEAQQDIQLMRFADFFARSFASVSASQFPWPKMFKESPVAKIADIPLSHISESVYKTAVEWIATKSPEALCDFVIWCFDGIISNLASQQLTVKGSKKSVQQAPSKAQNEFLYFERYFSTKQNTLILKVAIFVVLALVLRRKPDTLISLLPKLRENSQYQGQERLPIIIWAISQAAQGDPVVGMYVWAHYLFPSVCGKPSLSPHSRDLVLQLVERILSGPKARAILLNGAVRKGERLVPPTSLDLLMRAAFPVPTARIKATERFEVVYPALKELALAGTPGTKTTKQASQQLLPAVVQAIQEKNLELTKEATDLFIWCLIQNTECYKQWEKFHLENVDASISVLQKLSSEWRKYSANISPGTLNETLKHMRVKNEEALSRNMDPSMLASIKEADKYCKAIMGKSKSNSGCIKGGIFVLVVAVGVYFAALPSEELFRWEKLQAALSSLQSP